MPTLDFNGKQFIRGHHLTVPIRTLEIDNEKSFTGDSDPSLDDNLIIHGDNLEGLKALLLRYANSIKCIYIDPPYNTGNEGWIYNDNVNCPLMQEWLKKNSPVDGEDLERHDKWLCMMWPRLNLLYDLLSDDGVIFVSIDDNEQHHLRMLMDEIFKEENFRNIFVVARVKKNTKANQHVRALKRGYNFVLFYAKSSSGLIDPPTVFDEKGERWHAFDAPGETSTAYELFGMLPPKGRHWMNSKIGADELIAKGRLRPHPRTGKPEYLIDASDRKILDTNWTDLQEYDTLFNFPNGEKNVNFIKRIVGTVVDQNAIILDSFAGSGTTAHAVLALNKKDGGNRKFILIECEDYADEITAERVRRVIDGVKNTKNKNLKEGIGGSFTFCSLGDTIDEIEILTDEPLPDYETVANYIAFVTTGKREFTSIKKGKDFCFGETPNILFYLIYKPSFEFMQSRDSALNDELAQKIATTCKESGKKAYVYASHKFISQKELTEMQITFCQLPYNIYRIKD